MAEQNAEDEEEQGNLNSGGFFQIDGRSDVENTILCRLIFPENIGALMNFLHSLSPRWKISLFPYCRQVSLKWN